MPRITRAEAFLVDLVPKVKRTDAIQSFKSQETIFVTLTDAEGATGRGIPTPSATAGLRCWRSCATRSCPR